MSGKKKVSLRRKSVTKNRRGTSKRRNTRKTVRKTKRIVKKRINKTNKSRRNNEIQKLVEVPKTITLFNLLTWFRQQPKMSMSITEIREAIDIPANVLTELLLEGVEQGVFVANNSIIYLQDKSELEPLQSKSKEEPVPLQEEDDLIANHLMGDCTFGSS